MFKLQLINGLAEVRTQDIEQTDTKAQAKWRKHSNQKRIQL